MRTRSYTFVLTIFTIIMSLSLSGCTMVFQKGRRVDTEKITKLKTELTDLEKAKQQLEDRLKSEIDDKEVKVEMLERGLVLTFVAEVLFSPGKADLRKDSFERLGKVATVLKKTVPDLNVGVEGHTDSDPIKRSGWKSNWELSSGRALSVLHYLIDKQKVDPKRLSATGFGEYHPVASNVTKAGKSKNRRVEIVILPKTKKQGRE